MKTVLVVVGVVVVLTGAPVPAAQSLATAVIAEATRYVIEYEKRFWILALDEDFEQWLERPNNPGTNLSRNNPGGGIVGGGQKDRRRVQADFALVQAGEGRGWVPFRDIRMVDGHETRHDDDRLVRLLQSRSPEAFDVAGEIHEVSKRQEIGNVARTINIPLLGMMFLHPEVNERFRFDREGSETLGGRLVDRFSYREIARPTLIKTTRGRDLGLTGRLWIEPSTGVVVKTEMTAADPIVRATVTVTFRHDPDVGFWVPVVMEEYYKAARALDDIFAVSRFTNPRVFRAP